MTYTTLYRRMGMVSEKEIEAAREVLEQYVYDEGGCEVERVPAMVREMLEAAARVRAEDDGEGGAGPAQTAANVAVLAATEPPYPR